MNKKILVTGGAGFIGSHLCERLLNDGYLVASLDNFNPFYDPAIKRENIRTIEKGRCGDNFKSYVGDIRNPADVASVIAQEKPAAVVHLAAMAGVRPSLENPGLYIEVNICGTQVLLEACVKAGIKNFIFASSSSVYGNNAKVPFSESDTVDFPISPYAATKKAGELLCYTYTYLYPIKIYCLRFFTVYGPRQRPDLAIHKFSKMILDGKELPFFGDGETKRDYTYIEDIIDGVMKSLSYNMNVSGSPRYEIFNLGESRTISLSEMVSCLEKVIDKKAKLKKLPLEPGDVACTYADVSKAKKILHYSPTTEFEEGVIKFMEWMRRKELIPEHAGRGIL